MVCEDQATWYLVGHVKSFGLYSELGGAADEFQSVWSVYSISWNGGSLNSRENGQKESKTRGKMEERLSGYKLGMIIYKIGIIIPALQSCCENEM